MNQRTKTKIIQEIKENLTLSQKFKIHKKENSIILEKFVGVLFPLEIDEIELITSTYRCNYHIRIISGKIAIVITYMIDNISL